MGPSVGRKKPFDGAVLIYIVLKWTQERMNQILACRAELVLWG